MATATKPETRLEHVPRGQIRPSPKNARILFDESELKALGETIAAHGLLHPLIVRYSPSRYDNTPFELIDGERRFRASEGILDTLPVIVREVEAGKERELSLIANLQRTDLTAMEEAQGIRDLIEAENLSGNQVAKVLGMSRGWVQNRLDLLRTGEDVQAVAARAPYKMSSLLLIDGVKDKSTRADLLSQVESGAAHSAIKSQVENYQESQRQTKAQAKQSTHAPDSQTAARLHQVESNGHGTMSRGVLVTGTTPTDARQVIESEMLKLETALKSVENFWNAAPPSAKTQGRARLIAIQKRISELLK